MITGLRGVGRVGREEKGEGGVGVGEVYFLLAKEWRATPYVLPYRHTAVSVTAVLASENGAVVRPRLLFARI